MKIQSTMTAIAVSLAVITGCEADTSAQAPALPQPASTENPVLVTVNDTQITAGMFGIYYRERMQNQPNTKNDPRSQNQALNELIKIVLLSEDATKRDLDDIQEVKMALELKRLQLLSSIALSQYAKNNQPSDEALKKIYDEQLANPGAAEEFHARHILVKTEDEAKELIVKLNDGADFAELAKEHSTGPTGKSGGDLGWFGAGQMVKPFSDAVAAMDKGGITQAPVNTQFGWHVIKLEDKRSKEPPAFEDVKKKLMIEEQRRLLTAYVEGLSANATIQANDAFSKAAPQQPEETAAK